MSIYKNIVCHCAKNSISVSALEKSLGFGKSTIAKWESSDPTSSKLKQVADYFGVTVDELLRDDEAH